MHIDDRRRFDSIDSAINEAERIADKVRREADKNGYAVKIYIGVSEQDIKAKRRVRPHLHIVVYAEPAETVSRMIAKCINDFARKSGSGRVATRHNCYSTGYIDYVALQSRKYRYYENDPNGILADIDITGIIENPDPEAFRKSPSQKTDKNLKKTRLRDFSELPCNHRTLRVEKDKASTAAGGACAESPMRENRGKMDTVSNIGDKSHIPSTAKRTKGKTRYNTGHRPKRYYSDIITKDQWLSMSPRERASFYNGSRMKLSHFASRLHLTTKTITEDFERNGYHYDEIERTFKTTMQRHHDRMRSILHERKMQKLYYPFDD